MTTTSETLDQIQVFWSILLLPATIILNVTAFIMLLKSSGSCLKDPIVSPLLSVLGSNILHGIMVQIFSVNQNSVGEFIFSDRVCSALITNRDILVDIPFLTLSLQVVATIRNYLQSPGASYSHCSVCSSQVLVVLTPWLVSVLVNGVTRHTPSGVITQSGSCEFLYPGEGLDFIIHWSISLIAPTALVLMSSVFALPRAIRRHNNKETSYKQDTIILSVLFLAYIILQVPARILEWAVHYNNASDQAEIFSLILGIVFDLPLIINPLGVIILRGNGTINLRKRLSETELDHPLVSSPSEDNLTMIVAMDQQELENALFAAKTTSL